VSLIGRWASLGSEAALGVRSIAESRVVHPVRPDRLARALLAAGRYGATPATVLAAAAELYPARVALHDELGALGFGELDDQARGVARGLHRELSVRCGQAVAIMCRNHRGFVQAAAGAARLGCSLVPLNTDFAASQLRDVLAREGARAAIFDEEFAPLFESAGFTGAKVIAWQESPSDLPTLRDLMATAGQEAPPPEQPGRIVLLTSGTTGTPKGASRTVASSGLLALAAGGLVDLGRIRPVPRSGGALLLAPPLFHLFGVVGMSAGFALGSPLVLRRRFDPRATLEAVETHHAQVLFAVPTMLARILALRGEVQRAHDTTSLRMIVSGAAPLPAELAAAVMNEFGDILYNAYASTEVGSGTLATPSDLRAAPGTVGRPLAGVRIQILDPAGRPLPPRQTGRIFVGSPFAFDGYTGGGGKEVIDGLMSTGDLGHLDEAGRLFIDGRDDDMILSGGENVFPQEVEDLLTARQDVADAAVFGVSDPEFGQRLTALVVRTPGSETTAEELRDYVRGHLARFKVPREIEFVDELPRTSTGKLQRRRLAEAVGDGR